MVLPEEVKRARERLGESQEVFGLRLGVDQSTVHRWETDGPPKRGLVPVALRRILDDLAIDAEEARA